MTLDYGLYHLYHLTLDGALIYLETSRKPQTHVDIEMHKKRLGPESRFFVINGQTGGVAGTFKVMMAPKVVSDDFPIRSISVA